MERPSYPGRAVDAERAPESDPERDVEPGRHGASLERGPDEEARAGSGFAYRGFEAGDPLGAIR